MYEGMSSGCGQGYAKKVTAFPTLTASPSKSDKHTEKEPNMSFIGIKLCLDGIVAFGDGKSSRRDCFGNLCLDDKNSTVQKVFQSPDYVLTAFGNNEIPGEINIKLEKWVSENLNRFHTPYELVQCFMEFIAFHRQFHLDYHFIAGGKDDNGYYIQSFDIVNNQLLCSLRLRNAGDNYRSDTIPYSMIYDARFKKLQTTDMFAKDIRNWLEEQISEYDKVDGYNPVGLPIHIAVFH